MPTEVKDVVKEDRVLLGEMLLDEEVLLRAEVELLLIGTK